MTNSRSGGSSSSRSNFRSSIHRPRPVSPEAARLRDCYRSLARARPLIAPHADSMFETIALLGAGGMSRVHRIRDHRLGREAALKILSDDKNPTERRARFLREARILARLDHPNIPPLYEAGETADGRMFMLMKLIEGRTLAEILKERFPKPPRRAALHTDLIEALIKVCEALAYAHEQGVIHRDIKPENIMIGRHGEVYLMDWGVSRDLQESQDSGSGVISAALTLDGAVIGTPGFMAPEQAMGDTADERADVFSLGIVLTEILTGQSAIAVSDTRVTLAATVGGQIRTPAQLARGVPPALESLAARALSSRVNDRPAHVDQVIAELKAVLAPQPRIGLRRGAERLGVGIALVALVSGLLYIQSKRTTAELRLSEARIEADRSQERASDLAGRVTAAEGRAITADARASSAEESTVGLATDLSTLCLAHGKFPEAIRALDRVLEISPKNVLALNNRAMARIEIKDFPQARADLEHGIEIDPKFASFYLNLGWLKGLEKDFQGALDDFERAEKLGFNKGSLHNNRGWILTQIGRSQEAIAAFSKAIEVQPTYLRAWVNRASLYESAKKPELAAHDFAEALRLAPNDYGVLFKHGRVLNSLKRPTKALMSLQAARRIAPNNADILLETAYSFELLKVYKEAVHYYETYLRSYPQSPSVPKIVARVATLRAKIGK